MIYIDYTDTFEFFLHHENPTGIQRTAWEVLSTARFAELVAQGIAKPVIFLRDSGTIAETDSQFYFRRPALLRTFGELPRRGRMAKLLVTSIPKRLRPYAVPWEVRRRRYLARFLPGAAPVQLGRDDIVLTIGAGWISHPMHERVLESGARFGFINYDVLPLSHPQFFEDTERNIVLYKAWIGSAAAAASFVFSISRFSQDAYRSRFPDRAARQHHAVIRLGDTHVGTPAPLPRRPDRPPYVLTVSTIEIRKNHQALLDAWERLAGDLADPPRLVVVGRRGWLSDPFYRRIAATRGLNGLVEIRESVSDAELRRLYAGALFTVFPSLAEGWGLPVAESLALGVPCLASNATSIPEVGGDLVQYFDPADGDDLFSRLRTLITQPGYLADWSGRIASQHRPALWEDTCDQIFAALAAPGAWSVRRQAV